MGTRGRDRHLCSHMVSRGSDTNKTTLYPAASKSPQFQVQTLPPSKWSALCTGVHCLPIRPEPGLSMLHSLLSPDPGILSFEVFLVRSQPLPLPHPSPPGPTPRPCPAPTSGALHLWAPPLHLQSPPSPHPPSSELSAASPEVSHAQTLSPLHSFPHNGRQLHLGFP